MKNYSELYTSAISSMTSDYSSLGWNIWIRVRFLSDPQWLDIAKAHTAQAVSEKLGGSLAAKVNRHKFRTGRHTWIKVSWHDEALSSRSAGTDTGSTTSRAQKELAGVVSLISRSLARIGLDSAYVHIIPAVVPADARLPTLIDLGPVLPARWGRIEIELIQPFVGSSALCRNPAHISGIPPLRGEKWMQCLVDHRGAATAAELFSVWSRAWGVQQAAVWPFVQRDRNRNAVGHRPGSNPVQSELIAARRCPACFTTELQAAPRAVIGAREWETWRCPCCEARWLITESDAWSCLETGRLVGPQEARAQLPPDKGPRQVQARKWWRLRG